MAASLDDILSLFKKWKKGGNTLRMKLVQGGSMTLDGGVSISDDSSDDKAVFKFGCGLASGAIDIPLVNEFVRFDILTSEQPRPFDPLAPTYDICIQITWTIGNDRCTVCNVRGSGSN